MSVSTGTATSYLDLLSKLVTFLTTDSALTTAGQNWTLLAQDNAPANGDDVCVFLRAPGLSGSEQIFVDISAWHNTSLGRFNWSVYGAQGYNSAQPVTSQPGVSPVSYVNLWNNSIPYTFIANGQRVIVIAQIGTVYESLYAGKINVYGTPSQYPYPLAVGGTSITLMDYGDTTANHSAFFDPQGLWICWVDGTWQRFQNRDVNGTVINGNNVWPWAFADISNQAPTFMTTDLDGTYPLFAARLEMSSPAKQLIGELDGVFFTPGSSLTSGSTITVSSSTYLALQNVFRTAINSFAAILEA